MCQIAPCNITQLAATEDSEAMTAALGHGSLTIAVRNRSASACSLNGVPIIEFANRTDRPIPVHVCSNCSDYMFPEQTAQTIVLRPNQSAYVVIGYTGVEGNGGCKQAFGLRLGLTKGGKKLKIRLAEVRTCGVVNETPFLAKAPNGFFPGGRRRLRQREVTALDPLTAAPKPSDYYYHP